MTPPDHLTVALLEPEAAQDAQLVDRLTVLINGVCEKWYARRGYRMSRTESFDDSLVRSSPRHATSRSTRSHCADAPDRECCTA